jgi:hypothetical protein
MGWVVARITLALLMVGVLGHRWHEGQLSWPLILMSALICGLLVLEMFTAHRGQEVQPDMDVGGRPVPRDDASHHKPVEVDLADGPGDRVRTSPGGH